MARGEIAMASKPYKSNPYEDWKVDDAMHTMMRAGEIVKDKKMIGLVRKKAAEHANKMAGVAKQASQLAKMGRISPKAMAKMGKKSGVKKLDKTAPLA
jgi:hypothetical protein